MFRWLRVVLTAIAVFVGLACCVLLSPSDAAAPADAVCTQAEAREFLEGLAAEAAAGFSQADASQLVDDAIRSRQGRSTGRRHFRDYESFTLPGTSR